MRTSTRYKKEPGKQLLIIEEILVYTGQAACLMAALFVLIRVNWRLGCLFLAAQIMTYQGFYMMVYFELPAEFARDCIASTSEYYDCIPLSHKVSAIAAQTGHILSGFAIFWLARLSSRRGHAL